METSASPQPPLPKRLQSLDALRGFDMFLIIGGTHLIASFIFAMNWESMTWLTDQFKHVPWHGLTFEDVIFPLFLFMAGVSMTYSIASSRRKGLSKNEIYWKAFKRMIILSLLGIVYKNKPLHFDWDQIRYVSVLGRIGVTGFLATLIYLNSDWKGRMYWLAGLLIFYWAAMLFIPVPGYGAGDLSQEGNLATWINSYIVPGRLIDGIYDENGYFQHIPATGLVLMGTMAGTILRDTWAENRKVIWLTAAGGIAILIGLVWNFHFPINKHLWSSSFILVTGGISFLFMALFYLLIDVWGYQKWAFPFKVIGLNSLFIYLVSGLVDFSYTSKYLLNGFLQMSGEDMQRFITQLGVLLLEWGLLYFMYRRKIFIKV
ncbi:MAG TPA: DUF5009 domain-containing protein [Membranihabitans sp.]|nr:DUF5009 domain-containing protein [Membranihabitans sp.]